MQITLNVFNISGQKVATLASGRFTAGEHSVIFVAENLASGVYFYRLQTETGIHLKSVAAALIRYGLPTFQHSTCEIIRAPVNL
ncbi:MAG: T9SS type A sorting domain-containing protein [Calditrichia bacterium]